MFVGEPAGDVVVLCPDARLRQEGTRGRVCILRHSQCFMSGGLWPSCTNACWCMCTRVHATAVLPGHMGATLGLGNNLAWLRRQRLGPGARWMGVACAWATPAGHKLIFPVVWRSDLASQIWACQGPVGNTQRNPETPVPRVREVSVFPHSIPTGFLTRVLSMYPGTEDGASVLPATRRH